MCNELCGKELGVRRVKVDGKLKMVNGGFPRNPHPAPRKPSPNTCQDAIPLARGDLTGEAACTPHPAIS